MTKLIDLTGQIFGRLVVIGRSENTPRGMTKWLCKCDCGNTTTPISGNLKLGRVSSCGCIRKEQLSARNTLTKTKHKLCHTVEYKTWGAMFTRCTNKKADSYPAYGGRGISVCERWKSFDLFLEDMGKRPSDNHSIDRIDPNGNYEPSNCRWATRRDQNYNKRTTVFITHEGESKNIDQWAEIYGLPYKVILARLNKSKVGGSLFRPLTPRGQRTKMLG